MRTGHAAGREAGDRQAGAIHRVADAARINREHDVVGVLDQLAIFRFAAMERFLSLFGVGDVAADREQTLAAARSRRPRRR